MRPRTSTFKRGGPRPGPSRIMPGLAPELAASHTVSPPTSPASAHIPLSVTQADKILSSVCPEGSQNRGVEVALTRCVYCA